MAFVSVNYGENKRLLFNPNCQTRLFLEDVRRRCRCPTEMEIELADEFGNLKDIAILPSKYANQVLNEDREKLVLIQIIRNHSDAISTSSDVTDDLTYVPLLNNGDIVNAKFKARLGNRDPDSSRPGSKTKRSRDRKEKSTRRSTEMTSSDRRDDSMTPVSPGQRKNGSNKTKGNQNRSKSRAKNK